MRAYVVFIMLICCIFIVSSTVGQTKKKQTTVFGEVVDIVSYVSTGMKPDNADRRAVAERNVKGGNPLGILERGTGKIYLVTMQSPTEDVNTKMLGYCGVQIFAKGRVLRRGGIQLLLVSDIGKSVR
jgi:hypothetical protein